MFTSLKPVDWWFDHSRNASLFPDQPFNSANRFPFPNPGAVPCLWVLISYDPTGGAWDTTIKNIFSVLDCALWQSDHDGDKHNIRVEGGLSKNPTSGDFGFMCSDNEQYIASNHIAQLKKHLAVWRHVMNLTK